MTREEFIMQRVKEHYDEACSLGFEVVGVWLQGSQNYGLDEYSDEYMSDVDTKCIILPTLDDIVKGTSPYSSTYIRANNEHIDIKDIRCMIEMFKKQNNAYIEILFTDFYIINPKYQKLVDELWSRGEGIAHLNFNQSLRCLAGTSMEKYKALEHPYPGTLDKIEKFGYDPKQLHHILRIRSLMLKYISGYSYRECLIPEDREYLMKVKKGFYNLEDARQQAETVSIINKDFEKLNLKTPEPVNQETINFLDDMKCRFIKQYLKECL